MGEENEKENLSFFISKKKAKQKSKNRIKCLKTLGANIQEPKSNWNKIRKKFWSKTKKKLEQKQKYSGYNNVSDYSELYSLHYSY